jgi:oligosaccharide repeat unit polymerase
MQFLVGLLHGKLYREYKERSLFGTFVYCQMLGPLIMQFFQDEYFSLFSGWVQNILAGALTIFIFRLLSNDAAKQYQNSEHRIE